MSEGHEVRRKSLTSGRPQSPDAETQTRGRRHGCQGRDVPHLPAPDPPSSRAHREQPRRLPLPFTATGEKEKEKGKNSRFNVSCSPGSQKQRPIKNLSDEMF